MPFFLFCIRQIFHFLECAVKLLVCYILYIFKHQILRDERRQPAEHEDEQGKTKFPRSLIKFIFKTLTKKGCKGKF